jgi:hypothetical protein
VIFSAVALAQVTPYAIPMRPVTNHHGATAATHQLKEYFISSNSNLSEIDDSLPWGDSIHADSGDVHRIYFQNIDGAPNDANKIDLYVSCMSQFQIGTFCWADPGLDFLQFYSHLTESETSSSVVLQCS